MWEGEVGQRYIQHTKIRPYNYMGCFFSNELLFQVFSREEAEEMGLDEEMDWVEFGFEKTVWRIHLKWKKKKLLFHSEWHDLVEDCKLAIGDKCLAVSTFAYQRISLAVYHQNQATNCYQKGIIYSFMRINVLKYTTIFIYIFGLEVI